MLRHTQMEFSMLMKLNLAHRIDEHKVKRIHLIEVDTGVPSKMDFR